jgi:UDP-glucuronate 4-epimerase
MRWAVLGGSGFIGFHLINRLVDEGHGVVNMDNGVAVYGSELVAQRTQLLGDKGVSTQTIDLALQGPAALVQLLDGVDIAVHLAAWPGVRQSVVDPFGYTTNNVVAFANVLEACRLLGVPLLYASSSSVYGDKALDGPCQEHQADGFGLKSHYSVTKWIDEELTSLRPPGSSPALGLRFFTVFGPWGRPDMAYYIFARRMLSGIPLPVFGSLDVSRDFTYVQDTVAYIVDLASAILTSPERVLAASLQPSGAHVVNVCNGHGYLLRDFVDRLAQSLGTSYTLDLQPASPLDARATLGDSRLLHALTGAVHRTEPGEAIESFASWAREHSASLDGWST